MTAYNGQFTVVVTSESSANLQVVPADDEYEATSFSTQPGAGAVVWSRVGTTGNLVVTPASGKGTAVEIGSTGTYYSQLTVNITSGTGSVSYRATNPNSSSNPKASVNITLVVNGGGVLDSTTTTVSNALIHIYTTNSIPATPGAGDPSATGMFSPLSAAENVDSRSYVTAMDSLFALKNIVGSTATPPVTGNGSTLTGGSSSLSSLTGVVSNITVSGGYASSMTINGTSYSGGWQYRVYDLASGTAGNTGAVYQLSTSSGSVSAVMGAGDFGLSTNQLIIWGFDPNYGGVTFPGTYTLP
jgi:hypothetical protein